MFVLGAALSGCQTSGQWREAMAMLTPCCKDASDAVRRPSCSTTGPTFDLLHSFDHFENCGLSDLLAPACLRLILLTYARACPRMFSLVVSSTSGTGFLLCLYSRTRSCSTQQSLPARASGICLKAELSNFSRSLAANGVRMSGRRASRI